MGPLVRRSVAATSACALVVSLLGVGLSGSAHAEADAPPLSVAQDQDQDQDHEHDHGSSVDDTSDGNALDGIHQDDEHDGDHAGHGHDDGDEMVGGVYWAEKDYVEWESPNAGTAPKITPRSMRTTDTTIVHKLRVVYMRPAGSNLGNEAQVRTFFEGVSNHWSDQTNGAIRFEVQDFRFMDDPNGGGCKQTSDISSKFWNTATTAIWGSGQPADREHLAVIWPSVSGTSCTFGLGTAPSNGSLNHGGKVFALFDGNGGPHRLSNNGFVHELGHNLGLGHSSGVYCTDGNGEFEDGKGCTHDEYGDFFDTMGRNDDGYTPQISTSAKDKLGVLERTVTTETMTGGTRTFTIEGLRLDPAANAGDAGLESVKVIDPDNGRPYYIEYRSQSTDWKAGITPPEEPPFTTFPNTSVSQGSWPRAQTSDYGVRIIRIGTDNSQGGHRLAGNRLTQNPISNISSNMTRQAWRDGEEFTTRTGNVRIKVISTTESHAVVEVRLPDNAGPVFSGVTNRTVEAKSVTVFDWLAGVTAFDAGDGDVTSSIIVNGSVNMNWPGVNIVSYSVSDSNGNVTQATRVITVVDTTKPNLTVPGNVDIAVGATFDPRAGVSATDLVDGLLTGAVTITGSVNTAVAGEYVLTYSVTDSSANVATKQRTVRVLAPVIIDPVDPGGNGNDNGDPNGNGGGNNSGGNNSNNGSGPSAGTSANYTSRYGRTLTIPVKISGGQQTINGQVAVTVGAQRLRTVPVVNGQAGVVLPATLKVGTHRVVLTFTSQGLLAPTTRTVTVRIRKAKTKSVVKVKQKKAVAGKTRLKLTVRLKTPGASVKARGKVRILVGGKRVATVKVPVSGKRTVKLKPKALRAKLAGKKAKVRVRYMGKKNFAKSKSKVVKVAVRR